MGSILRVATVNLLNDRTRWTERRTLLARGLAELSLDLIALQEVTEPLGTSTAHWLADELGDYSVHVCPKAGSGRRHEGIAILSRLPVEGHEQLDLQGQQRTAQFLSVRAGGRALVLVNGHYYWPVGAHGPQVRQVGLVLDRIASFAPGTAFIVCGDYNATPDCRSIDLMRRSFVSTHRARHGREPDFTCPTPLISGGRVRRSIASGLCRIFSIVPSDIWRGTLDYIFASPDIRVVECSLILERPSEADPTLYASDHFGLSAILEV
ncbi:endonuclease/exonuclease/phosphatase family protein [Tundrisphaera lichenicola]|uniref:endonuclease/exonuclease/phosphatase family protein n=1 Tax=Tundrisphaera lichenicola TaxID=2029860 RepID=UPI003EC14FA7